jgi:hypothetical protein
MSFGGKNYEKGENVREKRKGRKGEEKQKIRSKR